MPAKETHLAKAGQDLRALERFCQSPALWSDHYEWACVMAFYIGVHYVEAVLAQAGHHSANHQEREALLKSERRYDQITFHYLPLYNISLIARYLTGYEPSPAAKGGYSRGPKRNYVSFRDCMGRDDVARHVMGHRLKKAVDACCKQLDMPPPKMPTIPQPASAKATPPAPA